LFSQIRAKASGKVLKPKPLSPRPHQIAAIKKTKEHFKSNERGKIIMPCGTGKSLTAFWIAKEMGVKSILVAVPSLALLQQTLKVWTREFLINDIEPEWFCVCSDGTVKDEQDDYVTDTSDLGIKVETDPKQIKQFLKKKTSKIKVVFTTYQSGRATAKGSKGFTYDLGIMDEAHKTVGSKTKEMAHLLHQKNIRIKKRIFMTATERLFRGDSDEFMSMDDPRDYGSLIYELSFKQAINSKPPIISDYKIITFGITVPEIEEIYNSNKYLEVKKVLKDITARELATALALRKAIKKFKINNAISFHRSIRRADNFRTQQELITKIYPEYGKLKSFHVRGDMPTADRAVQMREFAKGKGLMTNARCLTEGVDLPAIDCVCFTDPKRSKVDIVQAAGSALRLSKGKKFGYILIPIFIPAGADFNEAAEEQGFDDVAITVRALATTDTRISEYLRVIAEGKKPRGGSPVEG
jgi:predicted helicase